MNTKHTPGPWNTVILNGDRIAVVAHDSSDVATLTHASHADARLIAAAPELLAALEALLNRPGPLFHLVEDERHWPQIDAARAAIAKATSA